MCVFDVWSVFSSAPKVKTFTNNTPSNEQLSLATPPRRRNEQRLIICWETLGPTASGLIDSVISFQRLSRLKEQFVENKSSLPPFLRVSPRSRHFLKGSLSFKRISVF